MTELTFFFMEQNQEDEKNKPVPPFEGALDCPFCASSNITVRDEKEKGESFEFWCHCRECGADGPARSDRTYALKVWNLRRIKP